MTFHHPSSGRLLAAAVLGLCLALSAPTAALADPATPAKIGDTPADFAQPQPLPAKIGDTPVDDPGASRAPKYDPPSIQVVRPERTIVRNVDAALPIVLAGLAVLIALGGAGYAVVGTRALRRSAAGH
jgi:hypothetical protein